ncbi:Nuclear factor 7, ovary [Bagarius yarrelli]|uniref:Nuclear factor 7, ovary n=1 Tax=Bagarius yarrelli TaxID=175774 RepID=A0A556V963_BAGYA|nr:Nuclear factor 7, ovary [Bagarius yarrelli]
MAAAEVSILMFGNSGHQQFSLTEAILQDPVFNGADPNTILTTKHSGSPMERNVTLVNTPNLSNHNLLHYTFKKELKKAVCFSCPGPHAVLFMLNPYEESPNAYEVFKQVVCYFGEQILSNTIIVLYHNVEQLEQSLEKGVKENQYIKELLEKCDQRFFVFSAEKNRSEEVMKLLAEVDTIVKDHGIFSNTEFKDAEKRIKNEEKILQNQRKNEVSAALEELKEKHSQEDLEREVERYKKQVCVENREKAELQVADRLGFTLRLVDYAAAVGKGAFAGAILSVATGYPGTAVGAVVGAAVGGLLGGAAGEIWSYLVSNALEMASTFSLLSKKHFLCPLCEDIFSSPVTTPCGHSFCKVCLRKYLSRSGSGKCPHCSKVFTSRPHLSVNRILADVTEHYRKSRLDGKAKSVSVGGFLNDIVEKTDTEMERMIEERMQKMDKLKQSFKLLKNSCLREVQESHRVFSALLSSVEAAHKAVVAEVEKKQQEAEKRVERLVRELEKEITELKSGQTTSEDLLDGKEFLRKSFIHLPREMRDWSKVTLETEPCVGFTRKAMSDFIDTVRVEANKLSKAVEIRLNPRTAHTHLSISDDRKQVSYTSKEQEVPENPKRFDRVTNVMSKEAFISGRHYWEVEVGDKTDWDLGVARNSVNRKGKFTVSPSNGFWTLSLRSGNQYTANTLPPTCLSLTSKPKKIAIYLDYEMGRVSFFCPESEAHIYTFTDKFTERLHPIFNPGRLHGGKNVGPLTITTNCCSI